MAVILKQRAYAGLWFMAAGLVPALAVTSTLWPVMPPGHAFDVVIWFLIVPLLVTGLFGSLIGARILDSSRVRSGWRAALRGFVVTVASFLVSAVLISIWETHADTSSPFGKYELFAQMLFWILMVGSLGIGWSVMIVGAFAGWLLYYVQKVSKSRMS